MDICYEHKKLNPDEYLDWLNTYLSLLNDFASYVEKNHSVGGIDKMVSFLRVAEHVFNFFINYRSTYEIDIYSEAKEVLTNNNSDPVTYHGLKIERDRLADRIAKMIENDPKVKKRFEDFCNNLKEPIILGCQL